MVEKNSLLFTPGSCFIGLLEPYRYKIFYGGRGAAKSWTIAEALIRIADACTVRVLCTREYQRLVSDSVHRLLSDQIVRLGLSDRFIITNTSIRNIITGSEFGYRGLFANRAGIRSFEAIDIVWLEEADKTSAESLEFLFPTIRKPGSEIWVSFNTGDENDPIYQRFIAYNDPNAIVKLVNFDGNPWFSAEAEIERQYYLGLIDRAESDEERLQAQADYDHIWLGAIRTKADDGVIKRWKIDEFDTPTDARFFHGADWGFASDPTALIRCFIVGDDLFIDQEAFGHGVEIDETPALFDTIDTARSWPIKADCSRPETISYMKRAGYNISPASKWPGCVEDGVAALNGFKRIHIHPRCKRMIEEAKMYRFKKDKLTGDILPIILDKHNHGWDACIAEGELIETSRGQVPIEDVTVGDYVITRDGWRPVMAHRKISESSPVMELTAGGMTLLATPDHKVYTVQRGFIRMDALRYTDEILLSEKKKRSAIIKNVRKTRINSPVYDLSVYGTHEFFASGILVHNCRYSLDGHIKGRGKPMSISSDFLRRI